MVLPIHRSMYSHPLAYKRARRTATNVLAGDFDPRPARDVLTSVLNIGVYPSEKDEEARRLRREEKRKEREKERRREKTAAANGTTEPNSATPGVPLPQAPLDTTKLPPPPRQNQPHSFWPSSRPSHIPSDRPTIQIATLQRPRSITPPPMPSSPQSTPGPSSPGGTSRTSSKRPHTPDDDEDADPAIIPSQELAQRPRRKRIASRKGWKGWVEVDEDETPTSDKLIKLDSVSVLQDRRTRSGKSFDAIGVGKDSWV